MAATPSVSVRTALRHLPAQRSVIASLAQVVARDVWAELAGRKLTFPVVPGPEVVAQVRAPSRALVQDYLRHVGADVTADSTAVTADSTAVPTVPPHLWPQWSVPSAARALRGVPYRVARMINGGCHLSVNFKT